jgi:hypothetical protein
MAIHIILVGYYLYSPNFAIDHFLFEVFLDLDINLPSLLYWLLFEKDLLLEMKF